MDIIERVKKLLALSQSSNINEASAAAAKAQELIERYRLDLASVQVENNEAEVEIIEDDNQPLISSERGITWKRSLAQILARENNCKSWTDKKYIAGKLQTEIRLVGSKTNIEIVRYLFAYIVVEIERLCQKENVGKGKTWSNNFRMGAVFAIREKLEAKHKEIRKAYAGSQALVFMQKQELALEDFFKDLEAKLNLKDVKLSLHRYNPDGVNAGYRAGSSINMNSELNSPKGGKLLKC